MSLVALLEAKPRRPSDGAVQTLRVVGNSRRRGVFLGQQWYPALAALPGFETALGFDGYNFGTGATPTVGSFAVAVLPATEAFTAMLWKNAELTLYTAPWLSGGVADDPADAAFSVAWSGRADVATVADNLLTIVALDPGQALRVPVSARLFGTAGDPLLDGADAKNLAGKTVPTGWGVLASVPSLLVDPVNNIWLFLGNRAASLQALYDGGNPVTLGVARAGLAALRATAPAAGTADYCLDAGGLTLARLWTPPTYPFTADLIVGATATVADIASAVVTARTGLTFKAGAVAAYNAVQGATASLYIDDGTTIAEALDALFAPLGAWWKLTAGGVIDLKRFGFADPARAFAAHQVSKIERRALVMPTRRRGLGYGRNNRVHTDAEIAKVVLVDTVPWTGVVGPGRPEDSATRNVNRGAWAAGTTYAIGDFFTYSGSSYSVVAAHVASAGAPPPNANCQLLAAAGPAGAPGAAGAAGAAGANGKSLTITSDRQTLSYDGGGNPTPPVQTTLFTAVKSGSSAVVNWTIADLAGNVLAPATYLSAASGDSVSMTRAQFDAAIAVNGTKGVLVTGTMVDGTSFFDTISVVKVQAGSGGSGTPGATGAAGADGKVLTVTSDRQTITYDASGAAAPAAQTTVFQAVKVATAAVVNWSVKDGLGNPLAPTTSYLSAASGDTVSMTAAQFAAAIAVAGALGVVVSGTLTDGVTLTDRLSVVKVQAGTPGSPGSAGSPGAAGTPGAAGAPALGFVQDAFPGSGTFVSQLWYQPTPKLLFRWDGSAWQPTLGSLASIDTANTGNITVGAISQMPSANSSGGGISGSPVTCCSLTVTPVGTDSKLLILAYGVAEFDADNTNGTKMLINLTSPAGSIASTVVQKGSSTLSQAFSFFATVTGVSGPQTFEIKASRSVTTGSTGVVNPARIVVLESKR